MLTHLTRRRERLIAAAALLAIVLLLAVGASRIFAQGPGEIEVGFTEPQLPEGATGLVIFVDGQACADLPVAGLADSVVLGEGCVVEGSTVEFLVYGEEPVGAEPPHYAMRLFEQFTAELGTAIVLSNWAPGPSGDVPPDYMLAYVEALDGSDPAVSPVLSGAPTDDSAANEDENGEDEDAPAVPVVGNLGFSEPATSPLVLLAAAAVAAIIVAAGRRTTRRARTSRAATTS